MATNTTTLIAGLEEYRRLLNLHIVQMEEEYKQLTRRWEALNKVYEGEAAEQFRLGWRRTAENFHVYLTESREIMKILEERLASLRGYNQSQGLNL